MIDVPIAVRDALKDGGYKKNYRFEVGDVADIPAWEHIADFTVGTAVRITESDIYRIHCDTDAHFDYMVNDTTHMVGSMAVDEAGGYYIALGTLAVNDTVTITQSYYSLVLQRITNETQEVFRPEYEIANEHLVKESVKIDERMCSDDTIKFGLCEGSSVEFQAFDIPNLTGKRLRALIDVDYPVISYDYDEETNKTTRYETIETYTIPMGYFDVQESSRQASTGIRKISAYNKLKSEYLDEQANALIIQEMGTASVRIIDIISFLLRRYGIKTYDFKTVNPYLEWFDKKSKAKQCFTAYKYTGVDSGRNAFSPIALTQPNYSPYNKNTWMEGDAKCKDYHFTLNGTLYNTPLQIRVDDCVELIDTTIANYIQDQLNALESMNIIAGRTAAQMWNDLLNMKDKTKNAWFPLTGYFFYVLVRIYHPETDTVEERIYSNHHPNATGTFAQLGRTTFLHVSAIYIYTPIGIRYGQKFDSDAHIKPSFGWNSETREYDIENLAKVTGEYGEGDLRTTPHLPDGTMIPDELYEYFTVKALTGGYNPAELIEVKPDQIQNVTLRDLQTAVFETQCQFGKLDRVNNYFTGVELNNRRLYPADSLYPDDELYPISTSESGFRAIYSKLWADEGNIRSWRNLIITYKGLIENEDTHEHEESEKIYTTVIDSNGTDDYEVKNNWLFKNLVWADSESENWQEAAGLENIEDYATAMVNKMQSVSWFPFEMWCAGLPYVETGDEVEIIVGEHAYTSYVLRRTIKGIQNLQDEMINGTLDIF